MRNGFALLFVIFFMIIISTIVTISLRNVNNNYEDVHNLKNLEKAKLFLDNAIELSILGISQYDRSVDCAKNIYVKNDDFEVNVRVISYLTTTGACDGIVIDTQESSGTVFLEVELTGENIRLYKNVTQKI